MNVIAALIYWVIVAIWLCVLATVAVAYLRNPRTFGTVRLLLVVVAIDTSRNIIENVYFGLYFGSLYGLFPGAIAGVLGHAELLIIPKLINVFASCAVLGLLLLRWLPSASRERSAAELDLHNAESHFRMLVDGVKEYAIYLLDPDGNITSWNAGAARIKGYAAEDVIGTNVSRFYTAEDRATGAPSKALEAATRDGRFETKALRVRKDGTTFWAHIVINAIRNRDGRLIGFAKVTKDITEAKLAEERLTHQAHFDQLTDLPNRRSLTNDLARLSKNASPAQWVSAALFDLDGFKDINDTLGHSIGDRVLQEVALRLKAAAGNATVYRLGGDEFFLMLPNSGDPLTIGSLVASILSRLKDPVEIDDHRLYVAASAGIAVEVAYRNNSEELMANADMALYEAKSAGGQTYRVYQPVMRAKIQSRQDMAKELRRAWMEREFVLYYQPQVRLTDQAVVGAEALLRWRHPQAGLLPPGLFIEALSNSSAAREVGTWILQDACRAAARWHHEGFAGVRVGVNLFPAQFRRGSLLEDANGALTQAGLVADALELEITENIALNRDESILPTLQALRAKGVGLSFDDFGTGYASLNYLTRYPLSRIKIDRGFVQKIANKPTLESTAIVRSIITMAHNLSLGVIAEGVETEEQAKFLQARRCEEAQGYLYAKPMPLDEFIRFLMTRRSVFAGLMKKARHA